MGRLTNRQIGLQREVVAGRAHEYRALAQRGRPVTLGFIPVLEGAATDGDGDIAAFARLKGDLLESAQLLDRHIN